MNKAVDNDSNSSHDQLQFLNGLTRDIVREIFSYLNRRDCLTCMAVCRNWYDTVPQYSHHAWKTLRLDSRDIYSRHRRRQRCFGKHVEHVVLISDKDTTNYEVQLYRLLQKLLDWGCTDITFLGLDTWTITEQNKFISLVPRHLTHLELIKCESSIAPMSILSACPELTHFTCRKCKFVSSGDHGSSETATKITHLILDAVMDEQQKRCILEICPNLRLFIGASAPRPYNMPAESDASLVVDLDSLLSWCPKLNFVATDFSYDDFAQLDNPNDYISDDDGLRHFKVTGSYGPDQISRHLTGNQQTLEVISVYSERQSHLDLSAALRSLEFPKLRTMSFRKQGRLDESTLIDLLNRCPVLETLDLDHISIPGSTLSQPLNTMERLRTLNWTLPTTHNERLLFAFLEQCPVLEKLVISYLEGDIVMPNNFNGLEQLKHLEINGCPWDTSLDDAEKSARNTTAARLFMHLADNSKLQVMRSTSALVFGYRTLRIIATIPTLKVFEFYRGSDFGDEELVEFIRTLGATAIESLKIRNARQLPSAVLDALSELPSLATFSTIGAAIDEFDRFPVQVDQEGLKQMLVKSPSLASISFSDCTIIGKNGKPSTSTDVNCMVCYEVPMCNRTRHWTFNTCKYGGYGSVLHDVTIKRVQDG